MRRREFITLLGTTAAGAHQDRRGRRERLAKKEPKAIRAHQAQWAQKAIRVHRGPLVPREPQVFGS